MFSSLFCFYAKWDFFFRENKDKVEIYLSFGATREEACRSIAIQALKLALTPPVNAMR